MPGDAKKKAHQKKAKPEGTRRKQAYQEKANPGDAKKEAHQEKAKSRDGQGVRTQADGCT